jgi:hypothetical protein
MAGIFISHRSDESEGQAGRLFEGLNARFGGKIASSSTLMASSRAATFAASSMRMVGRNWLHAADKDGGRRLDTPEDFVWLEIAAALRRDIAVIPVLVQGAAARRPCSHSLGVTPRSSVTPR